MTSPLRALLRRVAPLSLALLLASCGGGGGGGGGGGTPAPVTPTTHAISGAVTGIVSTGVTMALTGAASATTTTGTGGSYAFRALADGTYTVTPSKAGYTFIPPNLSVTVGGADATGRDFTAPTTHTVTVKRVISHIHDDGTREDLPGMPGAIWVGPDGGTMVQTVEATPGNFTATVPSAPYWVFLSYSGGTQFWVRVPSGVNTVDVGFDVAGRASPVAVTASTVGTTAASGMHPWASATDYLDLYSWDVDKESLYDPSLADNVSSASIPLDWLNVIGRRLLPADRLHVFQSRLSTTPSGGRSYRHAVASASVTGVTVPDGVTFSLPALVFTAVPQASSLQANWSLADFDAATPTRSAGSHPSKSQQLEVLASPVPLAGAFVDAAGAAPLLYLSSGGGSQPNTDYGSLAYGNPLLAPWEAYLRAWNYTRLDRLAPGATTPAYVWDQVRRFDAIGSAPNPITPRISAIRNPKLGAGSALGPLTGVGVNPVISWDAPTTGTPSAYWLEFYELAKASAGTASTLTFVASLAYDQTGLTLGGGVLVAGKTYVLAITAMDVPGTAGGERPYRFALPMGSATVWTEPFSP
jgi:hypothetical protein